MLIDDETYLADLYKKREIATNDYKTALERFRALELEIEQLEAKLDST